MTTRYAGKKLHPEAKSINLALQGGGSLGAFTWGVLDRLLEDERIVIEAISGTSAGAMNAVLVADGISRGGPAVARQRLRMFWEEVSKASSFSPIQRGPLDILTGNWSLGMSPAFFFIDTFTHAVSPYQFNPLNINPLNDILRRIVDFEAVRTCKWLKLFISATNVETGRVRVFSGRRLTLDMVMASACLPTLFQAVEIDGQYYWDGGYMGNPVLFPFYSGSQSDDILIVQINPIRHKGVPATAHQIADRMNEISFNASLLAELRAVDFVKRMLAEGRLDSERYRAMNIHLIEGAASFGDISPTAKFNAERAFLEHLFDKGRTAATEWLNTKFAEVGKCSTVDIRAMFQCDGYDPGIEEERAKLPRHDGHLAHDGHAIATHITPSEVATVEKALTSQKANNPTNLP